MPKSKSLPSLFAHSLFFEERLERFTFVALYKRATVSDLLMSLFKKERKSDSLKKPSNHNFALSLTKNERFALKTKERITNPTWPPWCCSTSAASAGRLSSAGFADRGQLFDNFK